MSKSENPNEFVILYEPNTNKEKVFGYFCVYQTPGDTETSSFIEQWAFANAEHVDLTDNQFIGEVLISGQGAPSSKEEWLQLLKEKAQTPMQGFIRRHSLLFEYENLKNEFKNFQEEGHRVYSISLDGRLDWLILQSKPQLKGSAKNFYQVSILETLHAEKLEGFKGEMTFSKWTYLDEPKSFNSFILDGGIIDQEGLNLPPQNLKNGIFSYVTSGEVSPNVESLPDDEPFRMPQLTTNS